MGLEMEDGEGVGVMGEIMDVRQFRLQHSRTVYRHGRFDVASVHCVSSGCVSYMTVCLFISKVTRENFHPRSWLDDDVLGCAGDGVQCIAPWKEENEEALWLIEQILG